MDWSTAVVLIVALSFSIPLVKIWTNHQRRHRKQDSADDARVGSVEAELAELRERVETLERIVTDDRHHLNREFDRLDNP